MKTLPIYIIEHLEPELWEWCLIEYKHISEHVGRDNLWFTNIKKKDISKLENYGKVFTESVRAIKIDKACILDPESPTILTPQDSKQFDYFVFGGILGDHPPRKRTEVELTAFLPGLPTRNIGKEQLSTDNAVFVVSEIVNGKEFKDMKFQQGTEIEIDDIQSTILPFSYPIVDGKPHMSQDLIKYIIKKDKVKK